MSIKKRKTDNISVKYIMRPRKLRPYQIILNRLAYAFLLNNIAGQRATVLSPVGSGKTVCFNELISLLFDLGWKNIAVVHPRIVLSQDQLIRGKLDLKRKGHEVICTSFHSGKHPSSIDIKNKIREINTTEVDKLATIISQSKEDLKLPHITYSSYQSFGKLVESEMEFDLVIFDECHNLIEPDYLKWLPNVKARKILNYTATPVTKEWMEEDVREELFGKIIAEIRPKDLIIDGYIVRPVLHELYCTTDGKKDDPRIDIVDTVSQAFAYQYKDVVTTNGMPYSQMLVACRNVGGIDGDGDLRTIESRIIELKQKINSELETLLDVDVYTIDASAAILNGIRYMTRKEAIDNIRIQNRNVILLHYDTISEGIDIDTLTGCLFMRLPRKFKIIQTGGRCGRPYHEDLDKFGEPRKDLYDPEKKLDLRKKPHFIVTVPIVDNDCANNAEYIGIYRAFTLGGYGDLTTILLSSTISDGIGKIPLVSILRAKAAASIIQSEVEKQFEDMWAMLFE